MTITFEQYLKALESLPAPGSTINNTYKVALFPRGVAKSYVQYPEGDPDVIVIVTFDLYKQSWHDRLTFYWKPDATIIP